MGQAYFQVDMKQEQNRKAVTKPYIKLQSPSSSGIAGMSEKASFSLPDRTVDPGSLGLSCFSTEGVSTFNFSTMSLTSLALI